ncbi:MAG: hypothetical protein LUG60_02515 [Erysipelotrichaceae bacterium]|nr:hypothetical protein [Erysipelotrichaceae bacterium]
MKYQFHIINYKPYEYQLFQERLDTLGNNGYYCNDLSFISMFKKTDNKVYYKIDFFNMKGKTRNEKLNSRQELFDKYLDENYQPIYAKKGMYVFIGDHPLNENIKYNTQPLLDRSKKARYEVPFTISLFVGVLFVYYLSSSLAITSLLSYGIVAVYLGLILLCVIFMYRTYFNKEYIKKFNEQLIQDKLDMPKNKIKTLRKIYVVLVIICACLIGGGLLEDLNNAQSFVYENHPYLTLTDLDINTTSEVSTQSYSGFFAKKTYISLEAGNDDEILYIKEYQFNNSNFADEYIYEMTYDTDYTQDDNVYYISDGETTDILLIRNDNTVTYVSYGFEPTETQIETTIAYYK